LLLIGTFHCPPSQHHNITTDDMFCQRHSPTYYSSTNMGIASKISLPSPSWWKLNAIYLFNLTLILLFLILPAITGPATKLWWMTITYSTPGAKGESAGSSWRMGGLGVCKSGEECTGAGSSMAPAISGQIKSVLMYHFAGMSSPFPLMLGVWRDQRADQ
jgi:hypothetical protein